MPMLVFVYNWTLILSMNVLILSNKSVIYTKSVQIGNFFPFLSSIIEWYRRHLISRQYFFFPEALCRMIFAFIDVIAEKCQHNLRQYLPGGLDRRLVCITTIRTHIRTHTQINTPDNAHHINWLVWIIEFWWICHIQYMYTIFDCNESNQQFKLLCFFFDETSNKMKHHINLKPDTNSYNSVFFFVCRLIIYIAKVFSNLSDCERKKRKLEANKRYTKNNIKRMWLKKM